ncbi:MAG: alanine/ornithine racemase family PLP-dependent enzyme [Thermotogota bacterium]|nr:alanine/ornithine racemase family PLP-dependent enzyme [Thermotogota bacterium]
MAYVEIHPDRIASNAKYLKGLLNNYGIEMVAVSKVTCGDPRIVKTILENVNNVKIGESRVENLERIKKSGIDAKTMLLRPPSSDKSVNAIEYADTILVSELSVLERLINKSSKKDNTFIYMVDTGDLREGVWFEHAFEEVKEAVGLAGKKLTGIGTNLGCYGGVKATPEKFKILIELGERIRKETGYVFEYYSAGNTASLPLVENGDCPKGINQFRLGESIICGTDATNNRIIPGTRQDTAILYGEIIELKKKPSLPQGEIGRDAFGRKPKFTDKGWRWKAILDLGEQDVLPKSLKPLNNKLEVLHASSDHLIVDITESKNEYKIGEHIAFNMSYGALLRVMTSKYVNKVYL